VFFCSFSYQWNKTKVFEKETDKKNRNLVQIRSSFNTEWIT